MVYLPKNVAEAIERIWGDNETGAIKHLWLTNWNLLNDTYPNEYSILVEYATKNPVNYMQALTNGYDVEFDKDAEIENGGVKLSYSDAIKKGNFIVNFPIQIGVGSAWEVISIEEAKKLSDNINYFIQELNKVRGDK